MGKGGPLAFLNKKHFHPGSIRNVEEVWKREQKAAKEEARLEELRKQIAQERQLEELEKVAKQTGHSRPQDRIDWMYGGGVVEKTDEQRRKEEAAEMSKPATLDNTEKAPSRIHEASTLPSFYVDDTPKSANEAWARLNNDPLMMIRRQEQEAIRKIRKNPVQMERIKKEVKRVKAKKEKKKLKSRESPRNSEYPRHRHPSTSRKDVRRSLSPPDVARSRREGYGLKVSSFYIDDQSTLRRRAEDTKKRIREAEEKNAEKRRREESERHHKKRPHRVGRLSSEERAARLAQMTQDATHRHQAATERIREAERRDTTELALLKNKMRHLDSGHGAAEGVSVTVSSWVTNTDRKLEDSVTSRKYYSQSRREVKFGR